MVRRPTSDEITQEVLKTAISGIIRSIELVNFLYRKITMLKEYILLNTVKIKITRGFIY